MAKASSVKVYPWIELHRLWPGIYVSYYLCSKIFDHTCKYDYTPHIAPRPVDFGLLILLRISVDSIGGFRIVLLINSSCTYHKKLKCSLVAVAQILAKK